MMGMYDFRVRKASSYTSCLPIFIPSSRVRGIDPDRFAAVQNQIRWSGLAHSVQTVASGSIVFLAVLHSGRPQGTYPLGNSSSTGPLDGLPCLNYLDLLFETEHNSRSLQPRSQALTLRVLVTGEAKKYALVTLQIINGATKRGLGGSTLGPCLDFVPTKTLHRLRIAAVVCSYGWSVKKRGESGNRFELRGWVRSCGSLYSFATHLPAKHIKDVKHPSAMLKRFMVGHYSF